MLPSLVIRYLQLFSFVSFPYFPNNIFGIYSVLQFTYILSLVWFLYMDSKNEEILQARRHYRRAEVDGIVYNLSDLAYVKVNICLYFTEIWYLYGISWS